MATQRRYQKRKKSRRKKTSVTKTAYSLLTIAAAFVLLVTVNSFLPFSPAIPTWQKIANEWRDLTADSSFPNTEISSADVSVHYIDVGQGNCTLIRTKEHNILIDAGENDQGDTVVAYLKAQGVERLDYAVASHPHSDHIGGMDVVINAIPTENIIMPKLEKSIVPTTRTYEDLLDAIEMQRVNVIQANVGDDYEIDGAVMTILGPSGEYNDLNNMSVAVRFSYQNIAFLSTADMEKKAELDLLEYGENLRANVFLASHHGSKTSNTEEFLDQVGAEYYVIQCGYQNEYGHPHAEALKRFEERHGEILRSDILGNIVFETDGEGLTVHTQKEG